jgi:acid phosphatase
MSQFAADVRAGQLPDAGFVAPDRCHDAHDCPLGVADAWFAQQMSTVTNGPDWLSGRLAVVLTADEDDRHSGNIVLTAVLHPSQDHHVVTTPLDHFSLYGLYEDVLGLPHDEDHPSTSMATAFGLPLAS